MAQIRHNYQEDSEFDYDSSFEFLNKEGKSLLKVGRFDEDYTTKVFEVEEDEQVIGIKTQIVAGSKNHSMYNLQFKIGKLI